jgi:hypothetical protein
MLWTRVCPFTLRTYSVQSDREKSTHFQSTWAGGFSTAEEKEALDDVRTTVWDPIRRLVSDGVHVSSLSNVKACCHSLSG